MSARGKWQGMWTIVRFNWPFYGFTLVVLIFALGGFWASDLWWMRGGCGIAFAGGMYFLIGSLGVSHWVYDRSDLYRWQWLKRALAGTDARRMIFCHSGFDEASLAMRALLPDQTWILLDHYHPALMTEASIRRARKHYSPPQETLMADYNRWPVVSETVDVVFGLLAIHELRSEHTRKEWFDEASRCLRPGGRVVIAEHLRDLPNLVAFGPGFMHFHSHASWQRCWQTAGFHAVDEFTITPWVRVFILNKNPAHA